MKQIIYDKDKEKLFSISADIIKDNISKILKEKEYVVFGIAGGRSAAGIFLELKKKDIEWNRVHLFIVDERLVFLDAEESNYKLAKVNLFDDLLDSGKISEQNIHPFRLDEDIDDKGIEDYSSELERFGGKFDMMFVSSGEDGHIGALYPDHHSIEDESEYFIKMDDSPKDPPERMSMSRKLALRSGSALLVFIGDKSLALKNFFDESIDIKRCPAKIIKHLDDYHILTDIDLTL